MSNKFTQGIDLCKGLGIFFRLILHKTKTQEQIADFHQLSPGYQVQVPLWLKSSELPEANGLGPFDEPTNLLLSLFFILHSSFLISLFFEQAKANPKTKSKWKKII